METAHGIVRGDTGRRLQDELLVDILDHAPDAFAVMEIVSAFRSKRVFVYLNDAFASLYQCSKEQTIGMDVAEFMARRALPKDIDLTNALLAEGQPFTHTRPLNRPDGKTAWVEVNFRPFLAENQPARWIIVARDVTAKKLLQDRSMQLAIAVEEGNDLVAISAADETIGAFRFTYVNEAFTRATGYLAEELMGKTFMELMPPGTRSDEFAHARAELFAGRPVRLELRFRHRDGHIATFIATSKPIADPLTGKYGSIVTIYRDVTEERLHEAQLLYEAEHDAVTALHNRRYFERMLAHSAAVQKAETIEHALIFLDLDRFKEVNDRLGHEIGDEVLRAAAESFKQCIEDGDVLVRWGGDEFAALLLHCPFQSAQEVANCMLERLRENPARYWVTASIGVAPVLPGEPPSEAIKRADGAAYAAKSAGGDRVWSEPGEPAAGCDF